MSATIDFPVVIQFATNAYSRTEDAGLVSINVERTGNTSSNATVQWNVAGGTVTLGADFTAGAARVLTFAPGQTNAAILLTLVDDSLVESNETVNLSLSNPINAVLGATTLTTLTFIDNDGATNPPPSADLQLTKIAVPASMGVLHECCATGPIVEPWRFRKAS